MLNNSIDLLTQRMSLYQNGTISYSKRYILDLKCAFDYSKMPKDKHGCKFIFYPLAYDNSIITMKVGKQQK